MDSIGNWAIPYGAEGAVSDTVTALLNAMSALFPTGTTFGDLVVYKNNPSPTPTEFWLTADFSAPTNAPSSSEKAGWQLTLNMKTLGNRKAKFVVLDVDIGISIPFVRLADSFGTGLDNARDYIVANPNIVTIDGENIVAATNATGTLNTTAERRYAKAANTA